MKSFWSKHNGLRRSLCRPVVLLSVGITILLSIV